jgi:hypothetical protein
MPIAHISSFNTLNAQFHSTTLWQQYDTSFGRGNAISYRPASLIAKFCSNVPSILPRLLILQVKLASPDAEATRTRNRLIIMGTISLAATPRTIRRTKRYAGLLLHPRHNELNINFDTTKNATIGSTR